MSQSSHQSSGQTSTRTQVLTGKEIGAGCPGGWPGRSAGLSCRESEVLAMIVQGLSNEEIAERTFLSINTVKSYIRSTYRKVGVETRSRAVLWGVDNGFWPEALRTIARPMSEVKRAG